MRRLNKKGQVTSLEFGVFVIMIVLALLALRRYIQAAYQGRLKSGAESVGSPFLAGETTGSSTTTVVRTNAALGPATTTQDRVSDETTSNLWK